MKIKISKNQWEDIGQKTGWLKTANKWYDTSEGPTDPGNETGKWEKGWLKGQWKCPKCSTIIGKNLKNQVPFAVVEEHKKKCGTRLDTSKPMPQITPANSNDTIKKG
jgi:rubredoxin